MRIVVLGYIIRGPIGGLAWHHLQYVLGLYSMGHEVLFLEDSDDYPACYDPGTFQSGTDPSYGLAFIKNLFQNFELQDRWAYHDAHTANWHGWSREKVVTFCKAADVVLNLSCVNPLRDWWINIPRRILVDTDPAFTQINHLVKAEAMQVARAHTHFATYGENFGRPGCSLPDDGLPWKPTRQPLYAPAWKPGPARPTANWTTVMQWDSYRNGEYGGRTFGMKSMSFQPFLDLPSHLPAETFEIAMGNAHAPKAELQAKGWKITDPAIPSRDAVGFQRYIADSKGEWTVAKQGYVISRSGWFSERSLNYMAAGKPVVVQDTGLGEIFPCGEGLLVFSSLEEGVDGIKRVSSAYDVHCRRAREIALEYFDAATVLNSLLNI